MRKISWGIIISAAIVAATLITTSWIFGTVLARVTVDWFAITAGIFLAVEGTYKIATSRVSFFPDQFLRASRIIIGACVFTVHLLLLFTR